VSGVARIIPTGPQINPQRINPSNIVRGFWLTRFPMKRGVSIFPLSILDADDDQEQNNGGSIGIELKERDSDWWDNGQESAYVRDIIQYPGQRPQI